MNGELYLQIESTTHALRHPSDDRGSFSRFFQKKSMSRRSSIPLIFINVVFAVGNLLHAGEPKHVAVVAPQIFLDALKPWIEYRTAQEYKIHILVEPFETQQVEAQKVRERIRQLAAQVPLSTVLIVGNGAARSPDRTSAIVPSPRIPCRIIQDFGDETELATDDWYADLDDDEIPDLAVGRFPVDTPQELERLIRKTIRYETETTAGLWNRNIQIVAGTVNFTPLLDNVVESSVRFALSNTVPQDWNIAFLHADWRSSFCPSPFDFRDELAKTLNQSPLFWVYFGHGHHRMLDPLTTPHGWIPTLDAGELPRLQCHENPPIALMFCCYGGFLDRETPSLAEEMLLQDGGPVAVLAASRTTMPYGMSVLGIELFQEILWKRCDNSNDRMEFGALLLKAKHRLVSEADAGRGRERSHVRKNLETMAKSFDPSASQLSVQTREHAAMFHLFGDPLLGISVPKTLQLSCPKRVQPGSTTRIEGRLDLKTDSPKTVLLELLPSLDRLTLRSPNRQSFELDADRRIADNAEYRKSNDRVLAKCEIPFTGSQFSAELKIPERLRGRYVIRAFVASSNNSITGYIEITVGGRTSRSEP